MLPTKNTSFNGVPSDASMAPNPSSAAAALGARPLVLIVEDTDVSASLLCVQFRKLNCIPHRAENGEVAIEKMFSAPAPYRYSLVLMDLHMPVRLKVTDICPWRQLTFSFMDRLGDGWIRGNENH